MTFQGAFTVDDLSQAIRYQDRKAAKYRWIIFGCIVMILFGSGIALGQGFTAAAWGLLPLIVLIPLGLFSGPTYKARTQMKQHAHLSQPGAYAFDSSGFRIAWPSLKVELLWPAVTAAVEFENQFLLHTSPETFHVIPRPFLASINEPAWRALVSTGIGKPIEKA